MDTSMVVSPQKKHRLVQKYLVTKDDARKYSDIFQLLEQNYPSAEVQVIDSVDTYNGPYFDVGFFCGDFESSVLEKFIALHNQKTGNPPSYLIVGPAVMRNRLLNGLDLMPLKPCRPLYCEVMKNVSMMISPEVSNKRSVVDLVHYMGGSVRKEMMDHTRREFGFFHKLYREIERHIVHRHYYTALTLLENTKRVSDCLKNQQRNAFLYQLVGRLATQLVKNNEPAHVIRDVSGTGASSITPIDFNRSHYSDTFEVPKLSIRQPLKVSYEKLKECVHQRTTAKTNVLVATRVGTTHFHTLLSLKQTIVRPTWVDECWAHRDDPNFNVFDQKLVDRFRLAIFEGLVVYLHGFKAEEVDDMAKNLKSCNGKLTKVPAEATHIVYNTNAVDLEPLTTSNAQKNVTQEWFWLSRTMGYCAVEDQFALPNKALKKKLTLNSSAFNSPQPANTASKSTSSVRDFSEEASLNATPDYVYSNDDLEKMGKSPKPVSKRLQVCMEMYDTECNYVTHLRLLVKFKTSLEQELAHNAFIKKTDVAMVFGKFETLLEVHEKMKAAMAELVQGVNSVLVKKSDDKSLDFAAVWIDHREELKRVYPQYLNCYDSAMKLFNEMDAENPKFHAFCKAKESNPEFQRLSLTDMLVRPVQRLPSVKLLLTAMANKSESSRLRATAEDAGRIVDDILKTANNTRMKNDHLITHMNKFTDIENVPVHLVAANRMLIREITVVPIASSIPKLQRECKMRLFLFHDVLLVTKIRQEMGTMQRMVKQASFASLHSRIRRPYKYIEQIPLSALRNACRLRAPDDFATQCGVDSLSLLREPYVWLITLRDTADQQWIVETAEEDEMKEFIDDIHLKIMSEYGRFFMSTPEESIDNLIEPLQEPTMRHFKKQMVIHGYSNVTLSDRSSRGEWSQTGSMSTVNSSSTRTRHNETGGSRMRKAISNVHIQFNNAFGFGRSSSRSNLGQINENTPQVVESARSSIADVTLDHTLQATPRRGLKSRLSTSILGRTLSRSGTMRNPDGSKKDRTLRVSNV